MVAIFCVRMSNCEAHLMVVSAGVMDSKGLGSGWQFSWGIFSDKKGRWLKRGDGACTVCSRKNGAGGISVSEHVSTIFTILLLIEYVYCLGQFV